MSIARSGARAACVIVLVAPFACSHEITSPTPALATVTPDLACSGPRASSPDGVTTVELSGRDFTPMPSQTLTDRRELILPRITLSPVAALPGEADPSGPVDITDDPASASTSRVHWASESSMSFDVVAADALPAGVFDVTVTNPDGHRASKLAETLAIIPPPIITAASPMAICDDQEDQVVEVTGTSFLVYEGATPTVSIVTPGGTRTYASTAAPEDCAPIPGRFTEQDVRLCTAIKLTIPQGDIVVTANTTFDLIVTNPAPADCASSTAARITINSPPRVDSVVPATVCQGGAQLTVNGDNFMPGATVTLVCPGVSVPAATAVVNGTGTQITATFGGGAPAGERCDVVVTNPDGCEDRPPPHETLNVVTGPIVFYVDPSVVYNGINTRITIYATTIAQPLPADAVTMVTGGTSTVLAFNTVAGHPNRLQAIVPIGQAPGTYDLLLKDGLDCPSTLPAALTVTGTTSVTLKNVNAPFGSARSTTR